MVDGRGEKEERKIDKKTSNEEEDAKRENNDRTNQ
jgi:hypothetical protein